MSRGDGTHGVQEPEGQPVGRVTQDQSVRSPVESPTEDAPREGESRNTGSARRRTGSHSVGAGLTSKRAGAASTLSPDGSKCGLVAYPAESGTRFPLLRGWGPAPACVVFGFSLCFHLPGRQPGPWDSSLQCLDLDTPLLEQQNTQKMCETKNDWVHVQFEQILDKRCKKTKKVQLLLLKSREQTQGIESKSRYSASPRGG